jgi:hypothetical protein
MVPVAIDNWSPSAHQKFQLQEPYQDDVQKYKVKTPEMIAYIKLRDSVYEDLLLNAKISDVICVKKLTASRNWVEILRRFAHRIDPTFAFQLGAPSQIVRALIMLRTTYELSKRLTRVWIDAAEFRGGFAVEMYTSAFNLLTSLGLLEVSETSIRLAFLKPESPFPIRIGGTRLLSIEGVFKERCGKKTNHDTECTRCVENNRVVNATNAAVIIDPLLACDAYVDRGETPLNMLLPSSVLWPPIAVQLTPPICISDWKQILNKEPFASNKTQTVLTLSRPGTYAIEPPKHTQVKLLTDIHPFKAGEVVLIHAERIDRIILKQNTRQKKYVTQKWILSNAVHASHDTYDAVLRFMVDSIGYIAFVRSRGMGVREEQKWIRECLRVVNNDPSRLFLIELDYKPLPRTHPVSTANYRRQ